MCRFQEIHPQDRQEENSDGHRQFYHQRHPYQPPFNRFPPPQGRQDFQDGRQQHQEFQRQQGPPSPPQQYNQPRPFQQQQQQQVQGGGNRPFFQQKCYVSSDPGHKAGTCPTKGKGYTNPLYSKKPVRRLGKLRPGSKKVPNIVQGFINGSKTSFLLDTGADITVINKRFIKGEQLTGELVTLEAIEGISLTYPTA